MFVFLAAAVASLLFFWQGGFGRGHGDVDRALGLLAMPWILLPWPHGLELTDFQRIVLLAFFLNCACLLCFTLFVAASRRR